MKNSSQVPRSGVAGYPPRHVRMPPRDFVAGGIRRSTRSRLPDPARQAALRLVSMIRVLLGRVPPGSRTPRMAGVEIEKEIVDLAGRRLASRFRLDFFRDRKNACEKVRILGIKLLFPSFGNVGTIHDSPGSGAGPAVVDRDEIRTVEVKILRSQ